MRRLALTSSVAALMLFTGAEDARADFITPLVIAAGVSASVAPFVSGAIGIGLSFAASALTAKTTQSGATGQSGTRVSLRIDPNAPKQALFGRTLTRGSLAFWHVSDDSKKLWLVIDLAHHECHGLHTKIWVDGRERDWNAGTGVVSDHNGNLKVRFYSGTAGQTADSALVAASAGRWTSAMRGAHVCYAVVEATYTEKDFPGGIPEIGFVVDGAKLYDRRLDDTAGGEGDHRLDDPDTWEWSDNPAVILDNVLTGLKPGGVPLIGMNVAAGAVRYDDFAAAANACDEEIALGAGGDEKRYRCGAVFDTTLNNQAIIETVLASMAGELIETGGLYRILAGVTQPVVAALTEADLYVNETLSTSPLLPRSEIVNGVHGSYSDPSRSYAIVPLPLRQSSLDVAQDKGSWTKTLELSAVNSRTQAQRIMEIERRRGRRMLTASCTLRAYWSKLEPGDWITLSSDRRGWVNQGFAVVDKTDNEDLSVNVVLRAIDDELDDWETSDEIADDAAVDLGPAGPALSTVSGLALATILVTSGGSAERPGLRATWTGITDPTVIGLLIQYREIGSDVTLERRVFDAAAGSYEWVDGIQGDTDYEIRARLITQPERSVTWTGWVDSPDITDPQVVNVGETTAEPAPDSVTPEMLTPQARFELGLSTALADVQGSVAERLQELYDQLQAFAAASLQHRAETDEARARVTQEIVERVSDREAFAQALTQVEAEIEDVVATALVDLESRVEAAEGTIVEAEARALLGVQIDGGVAKVVGAIDIYANLLGSIIQILADKFVIAKPDGTGATQIFTVGTSPLGGSRIVINGDLIANGTIVASQLSVGTLEAISADVGTLTAGILRDVANTYQLQIANGLFTRVDNKSYIDLANNTFRFSS